MCSILRILVISISFQKLHVLIISKRLVSVCSNNNNERGSPIQIKLFFPSTQRHVNELYEKQGAFRRRQPCFDPPSSHDRSTCFPSRTLTPLGRERLLLIRISAQQQKKNNKNMSLQLPINVFFSRSISCEKLYVFNQKKVTTLKFTQSAHKAPRGKTGKSQEEEGKSNMCNWIFLFYYITINYFFFFFLFVRESFFKMWRKI